MTVMQQMLLGGGGFSADAADFDGTNDYMTLTGDFTGMVDGKQGTVSFWVRIDGGDGVLQRFLRNGAANLAISRLAANTIQILANNVTPAIILSIATAASHTTSATWKHVLASWDLATAGARFIYVNDIADLAVTTFTNDTINYVPASNWGVGATTAGGDKLNGCLAEFFFHTTYLDISVEANRRKFISATGKPVNLGANGSTPLGVQPLVYQRMADGAAASTFATNLGSGGAWTITGALDTASTSPSD